MLKSSGLNGLNCKIIERYCETPPNVLCDILRTNFHRVSVSSEKSLMSVERGTKVCCDARGKGARMGLAVCSFET